MDRSTWCAAFADELTQLRPGLRLQAALVAATSEWNRCAGLSAVTAAQRYHAAQPLPRRGYAALLSQPLISVQP